MGLDVEYLNIAVMATHGYDKNQPHAIHLQSSSYFGIWVESHSHDDVIKWKHFPRYWPFVRGIHRSPVNSTHKGQ